MRPCSLSVAFAVGLSSFVAAQQPTLVALAAGPLTTQAQVGTQNQTATVPPGQLPAVGNCLAIAGSVFGPNAIGTVYWTSSSTDTAVAFTVSQQRQVLGTVQGSSALGPNQIVVQVTSAVTRPVTVRTTLASTSTPGLPAANVAIDLGDDGQLEYTGASYSGTFAQSATIGPAGLRIRLWLSGGIALGATGAASDTVSLEVVPDNALQIVNAGAGCLDNGVVAAATWAGSGVALGGLSLPPPPVPPLVVAVAGLAPQPLALPSIGTPWPCLVMPRADVLSLQYPFAVAMPPAVRPVTVWLQYVVLQPNGQLGTTNAFGVYGN